MIEALRHISPSWQNRLKRAGQILLGVALLLFLLNLIFPPPIAKGRVLSTLVTDMDGRPLRAFSVEDGRWRLEADLERIDPVFVDALIAVEDKRFYDHFGVDPLAVIRATGSLIRRGEIVSGASTITMQTARLLEPRPRTIPSKLIEMARAVQLELRLSKDEILELYLTLAPYGGNLEGIRSASWAYFAREPDRLSYDQIALLIALPQSPEVRRPDLREKWATAGRAEIAAKLKTLGVISEQQETEVNVADLPARRDFPSLGWHVSDQIRQLAAHTGDVRSTLHAGLQSELERLVANHLPATDPSVQMSAIVVDVETRAVKALVGSGDRTRAGGWLNLTQQARSPGSTLKPFIYGLAFDDGFAAPDTHIQDLPKRFDSYRPENFDRSYNGEVRVKDALQHSLNIPAVLTLDRIGPERFAASLGFAGVDPRVRGAALRDPGLALALGGVGLTVEELALLYAALADGGHAKPLNYLASSLDEPAEAKRLMSAESSSEILDILRKAPAPKGRMPSWLTEDAPEIAFKTGTSYGFRDAWAAGAARGLVVVVWTGRADGAPRSGITGRDEALPVLFDAFDVAVRLMERDGRAADRLSDMGRIARAPGRKQFNPNTAPPEILFPPSDAELWGGTSTDTLRSFVLSGRGEGELKWYVEGEGGAIGCSWRPDLVTRNGWFLPCGCCG